MAPIPEHELWGTPEFIARMSELTSAAGTDPRARSVLKEALKMVEALESGIENGHHPLGFTPGKGDLRDCTVSEFRSNPQAKFDHRLTWRQLPPQSEGSPPAREIVDVGPRHGTPPFYERQCQILGRTMSQEVQANEVFGHRAAESGGNQAARSAALQAQWVLAMSRDGVAPMTKSTRLEAGHFGTRRSPPAGQIGVKLSKER
jgi:hypothetical protein